MKYQIYKDDEIDDQAIEQFIDVSIKYAEALETKQAFKNVEKFILENYPSNYGHITINDHVFKIIKVFKSQTLTYMGRIKNYEKTRRA